MRHTVYIQKNDPRLKHEASLFKFTGYYDKPKNEYTVTITLGGDSMTFEELKTPTLVGDAINMAKFELERLATSAGIAAQGPLD
jgi:hypothetical protein